MIEETDQLGELLLTSLTTYDMIWDVGIMFGGTKEEIHGAEVDGRRFFGTEDNQEHHLKIKESRPLSFVTTFEFVQMGSVGGWEICPQSEKKQHI